MWISDRWIQRLNWQNQWSSISENLFKEVIYPINVAPALLQNMSFLLMLSINPKTALTDGCSDEMTKWRRAELITNLAWDVVPPMVWHLKRVIHSGINFFWNWCVGTDSSQEPKWLVHWFIHCYYNYTRQCDGWASVVSESLNWFTEEQQGSRFAVCLQM